MNESIDAQIEAQELFVESIVGADYIGEIQRAGNFDDVDEERLIVGLITTRNGFCEILTARR
jgi:hypothetical protein